MTLSIFAPAFELSPLLFQSTHSTQIAPVAPASASIRRRQPLPSHTTLPQEPFFRIRQARKKELGYFPQKTKGGGSPHLRSRSMGERLLNPHYNQ